MQELGFIKPNQLLFPPNFLANPGLGKLFFLNFHFLVGLVFVVKQSVSFLLIFKLCFELFDFLVIAIVLFLESGGLLEGIFDFDFHLCVCFGHLIYVCLVLVD